MLQDCSFKCTLMGKKLNFNMNCDRRLKCPFRKSVLRAHSQSIHPGSAFKELTEHLFFRINKTRKGISVFAELNHNNSNLFAHLILL